MLDSFYRMTLKLFCYHILGVKTSIFCHRYVTLLWALFHNITNLLILIHGVISLQYKTSYDKHQISYASTFIFATFLCK